MKCIAEIENWYRVFQIEDDLFMIHEPGHVTFFVYRNGSHGLFIDTGLGLSADTGEKLLKFLGLATFDVVCTHAHCDHVGLNYRACRIFISKAEWEKYVARNDAEQLGYYYQGLRTIKEWPEGYDGGTQTRAWQPTDFVEGGDTVQLNDTVHLSVINSSGHTVGSLMLLDSSRGYLFTGDLIYTGMMYLNLKDSDFEAFRQSIETILMLTQKNATLQIWPSHNKIPLPADYPLKVHEFISKFQAGSAEISKSEIEANAIFEEAIVLRSDQIKMMVKRSLVNQDS